MIKALILYIYSLLNATNYFIFSFKFFSYIFATAAFICLSILHIIFTLALQILHFHNKTGINSLSPAPTEYILLLFFLVNTPTLMEQKKNILYTSHLKLLYPAISTYKKDGFPRISLKTKWS